MKTVNISLLMQSLDAHCTDETTRVACLAYLRKMGVSSLAATASALGLIDFTPLLGMLAHHVLFTDLSRFSLTEPDACFITHDARFLQDSVYDAWSELCRDPNRQLAGNADRLQLPLAKHLLRGVDNTEKFKAGATGRTARRWGKLIKEGEQVGLSAVVALTPRHHRSGNRNSKRPDIVLAFSEHVIRTHWPTVERPTLATLYRIYKNDAEVFHPAYQQVSKPTFSKIFRDIKDELARGRGGNRSANAAEAPTDVMDRALQANRPLELASCDHYLIDLYCEVLDANGMTYAVLPWLTVLRDCYTKSVLAFWLTLKAPSRRSCALIMRQCVRLHGRLPETIVVDRGAEFSSVYFSALLAHCRVNLMRRPSGHPRYGSESERFFGQFKDLWLSARPGNKISVKEVRSVSGSHRPEKHACLTLLNLWEELGVFNRWFDNYATASSLAAPSVLMARGLARYACSGRQCAYDDTFVIASAVDDKKYTVDAQRGLHIGAFHYWTPELSQLRGGSAHVRIDPEDPYRVYALVGEKWVTCLASRAPTFTTQSSLAQAVEGVLMLDGSKVREVAKADADRDLVNAIRTVQENPASQTSALRPPTAPFVLAEPDRAEDFFTIAASTKLNKLETPQWTK